MATDNKKAREGQVNKFSAEAKTKSYSGLGTSSGNASNAANATLLAGKRLQSGIQNMDQLTETAGQSLLTDDTFDPEKLEEFIQKDINARSGSGNFKGYTDQYDSLLGAYDPTTFLKAYKGYVSARTSQIDTAKSNPGLKQTFLTGGL